MSQVQEGSFSLTPESASEPTSSCRAPKLLAGTETPAPLCPRRGCGLCLWDGGSSIEGTENIRSVPQQLQVCCPGVESPLSPCGSPRTHVGIWSTQVDGGSKFVGPSVGSTPTGVQNFLAALSTILGARKGGELRPTPAFMSPNASQSPSALPRHGRSGWFRC